MKMERKIKWLLQSTASQWLLLITIIFTALSAAGLKNMGLASDYKIFFDKDDQDLMVLERMRSTYTTTDNIFIMIKPDQGGIYTQQTLRLIYDLTRDLWRVSHATRVDSLTNFPYSKADQDDILIEEFIYESEQITPRHVEFIANTAQKERDLVGSLITQDGSYTAINVTTLLPGENHSAEILSITRDVKELLAKYSRDYPEHQFYVTGVVAMNGAFIDSARRDFVTLIPLMMVFVLIATGFILGSIPAAGAILVVILLSLIGALGMAGWLGIKLSAPSVSAPIIMFTVIVASAIHIISYVKKQLYQGKNQFDAVLHSYQRNAKPIVVTHLTTIIGFLAMNTSESPPFRDLGNIVSLGVLFSLLLMFTVLPQLLLKFRLSGRASLAAKVFTQMNGLSNFVIAKKNFILFFWVPVSILFASLSIFNELNDDLIKYFDESVSFRADSEKVDQHFSGVYNIDYSLSSNKENGIFQLEYLTFFEAFDAWLLAQPEVMITDSALHRIKDLNRLMNGDQDSFYRLPEDAAMAAQHFLLYEMSLPYGKDVDNQVSFDKTSLKLTARLGHMSSQGMIQLENRINSWLKKNQPSSITIQHSSPSLIFSHIGQTNIISLLKGAFMAFIVISIALSLVFRSVYIGILSLIPNILPIGVAYGFWYCVHGQISMGLASVSAMAIGIIVDDTVHFLYQYIIGLKRGLTPEQSVRETFEKTMSAIVISSVLLTVGFMLLSFSSFEKNAQIGILTSTTIVLAMLFDLFLLPAIVLRFFRRVSFANQTTPPAMALTRSPVFRGRRK